MKPSKEETRERIKLALFSTGIYIILFFIFYWIDGKRGGSWAIFGWVISMIYLILRQLYIL